jgi:hypothetical protein
MSVHIQYGHDFCFYNSFNLQLIEPQDAHLTEYCSLSHLFFTAIFLCVHGAWALILARQGPYH